MSAVATIIIGSSFLFSAPEAINDIKGDIKSITPFRIVATQSIYLTACVLANSDLDGIIQNHLNNNLFSQNRNECETLQKCFKPFGEKNLIIAYATAWATTRFWSSNHVALGQFSNTFEHIMKATIVGGTMTILSQQALGGDRPCKNNGSKWRLGGPDHGVSGHATLGAIPFLVMSNLATNPYSKLIFTTLSFCTGFSRMFSNSHYPSQVLLGWSIAKSAVDITTPRNHLRNTLKFSHNTTFLPFSTSDGRGLKCSITY